VYYRYYGLINVFICGLIGWNFESFPRYSFASVPLLSAHSGYFQLLITIVKAHESAQLQSVSYFVYELLSVIIIISVRVWLVDHKLWLNATVAMVNSDRIVHATHK